MADEALSVLRIVFDWHARRDDGFSSPIVRGMTLTKPQDRIRNRDPVRRGAGEGLERGRRNGTAHSESYVQFLLLTACRRNEAARMTYERVEERRLANPGKPIQDQGRASPPIVGISHGKFLAKLRIPGCDFIFTSDGAHAISGFSRFKAKLDEASGVDRLYVARPTADQPDTDERGRLQSRPCRAVSGPRAARHPQELRLARISRREARRI